MALRQANGRLPWHMWPLEERDRQPKVLSNARQRLAAEIRQYVFEQFMFEQQWQALKGYANTRGVKLFGDMPIFVAHDSAEVWAHRDCFELDAQGRMEVVTGVPPDYFSATGQRWGNPHYRWEVLRKQDYDWWVARMETALAHFDLVRIDHFRGFESCWEFPADTEDAQQGHWVSVPGAELFATLTRRLGTLPVVAEDLGLITDEVEALRTDCGFPGMKVMQFGFSGEPENPHLLHMHTRDSVVYTGTHDNDTTVGWFENLEPAVRTRVLSYLGHPVDPMPWPLIRWALASPACLAILPFQDLLMLGSDSRMNLPGTAEGNWRWRFSRDQIPPTRAADVRSLVELYGRVADQS